MKNKSKIWLSSPHIGDFEQRFIEEAFESNWIAPLGPNVDNFEKELSDVTGANHVVALSSGTAALHLALILAGVGSGDHVICSSFTFAASANPIRYQGAIPVFIDSERLTWNMDPALLEQAVSELTKAGKKPKAIIVVHIYGMPAQMDRIMSIAKKYQITVIEDAAEALGSTYLGRQVGTFGKYGILSFNGNKIITTSGGGALLSDDHTKIELARHLATQARDPAPHYEHSRIGYNYQLSNVLAGIGRGQLKVLKDRVAKRRSNFDYYYNNLLTLTSNNRKTGIPTGIDFLKETKGCYSNRWLTTITVDPQKNGGVTREHIRLALGSESIEARPLWKPMHIQPVFNECQCYVNGVSEYLFQNGLCLPSGSNLSKGDLERIRNAIQRVFE